MVRNLINSLDFHWTNLLIIEFNQDLSEHYADKMVRIQQKVDNLRIAALG
jgi:hypothetical protein